MTITIINKWLGNNLVNYELDWSANQMFYLLPGGRCPVEAFKQSHIQWEDCEEILKSSLSRKEVIFI